MISLESAGGSISPWAAAAFSAVFRRRETAWSHRFSCVLAVVSHWAVCRRVAVNRRRLGRASSSASRRRFPAAIGAGRYRSR